MKTNDVIQQNILTPHEVDLHIAAADAKDRCALRFLYDTGVRIGELRGAMRSDIDWTSSRILIRRRREEDGTPAEPKTQAGVRWIPLSAELRAELKAHLLRTPGDFLFPIDERNFRSRVWHPSLSRAGLRRTASTTPAIHSQAT